MALRIRMGQYLPRDSRIHRLDPRAKLACALAVMVTVFFIQTPLQLALGLAFALVVVALSKVPLRQVAQSIRPLVVLLCVLGLFNLFYVGEGATLFSLGPVRVTSMGLWWAVCYPLRFTIAILMGALILLTTTPTQLTDAFEACLSPLSRVGLPGHELAMVFSLMLRFIPTIADEASAILDAQTARGGAVTEGSFAPRARDRPRARGAARKLRPPRGGALARARRPRLRGRLRPHALAPAAHAPRRLARLRRLCRLRRGTARARRRIGQRRQARSARQTGCDRGPRTPRLAPAARDACPSRRCRRGPSPG